jgi:hypothetical protein
MAGRICGGQEEGILHHVPVPQPPPPYVRNDNFCVVFCFALTWIVLARDNCSEDWDAWHARHAVKWRNLPGGLSAPTIEWKVPAHIVKGNAYLPMGTIDNISNSSSISSVIAKTAAQRLGNATACALWCG